MPLRRDNKHEPIVDLDILTARFPLTTPDGKEVIWGEVSDFALREAAMRDGKQEGLEKHALFEHYRPILEGLASELYDEGKYGKDASTGMLVVRVPNGRL